MITNYSLQVFFIYNFSRFYYFGSDGMEGEEVATESCWPLWWGGGGREVVNIDMFSLWCKLVDCSIPRLGGCNFKSRYSLVKFVWTKPPSLATIGDGL